MNLYSYVGNDALNSVDPFGLTEIYGSPGGTIQQGHSAGSYEYVRPGGVPRDVGLHPIPSGPSLSPKLTPTSTPPADMQRTMQPDKGAHTVHWPEDPAPVENPPPISDVIHQGEGALPRDYYHPDKIKEAEEARRAAEEFIKDPLKVQRKQLEKTFKGCPTK